MNSSISEKLAREGVEPAEALRPVTAPSVGWSGQASVLLRLVIARHRIGFSSFSQRLAFYLQINPISNLAFSLWFRSLVSGKSWAGKLALHLLRHGFGFGALRNFSPEGRQRFAQEVLGLPVESSLESKDKLRAVVDEIRSKGYLTYGNFVTPKTVEAAKAHFGSCPYFNAQIHAQSDCVEINRDWRVKEFTPPHRFICFRTADSTEFLKKANIDLPFLKSIADAYCGFDTQIYGINTMGTFPGKNAGYAMRLHRDYDDFRFLTFFISWTTTAEDDGATLFVPYSHRLSSARAEPIALCAAAGDLVAVDTFGLHAGNHRVKNPRLTTWIRFGHRINLATIQDGI